MIWFKSDVTLASVCCDAMNTLLSRSSSVHRIVPNNPLLFFIFVLKEFFGGEFDDITVRILEMGGAGELEDGESLNFF